MDMNMEEKAPLNVELFLEVKKRILAEPRQFQMALCFNQVGHLDDILGHLDDIPYREKEYDDLSLTIPNCGTAACLYGHGVCVERSLNPKEAMTDDGVSSDTLWDAAQRWGLPNTDLFHASRWPDDLRQKWVKSLNDHPHDEGAEERAKIAAEVIDRILAGTFESRRVVDA